MSEITHITVHPDEWVRNDVFADDEPWSLVIKVVGDQTIWWSQTGSNRRPHACKARALPAELWPHNQKTNAHSMKMVGLGRLELPTSRLSSARSNQLSYKPLTHILRRTRVLLARIPTASADAIAQTLSPWRVFVREERETKTAKSRQWSSTIWRSIGP
jgi:hypothetical protein